MIHEFREFDGVQLLLQRSSVEWLDGYLNRIHVIAEFAEDMKTGLVNTIGSYLGQCIIENYGGEWAIKDGALGIILHGVPALCSSGSFMKPGRIALEKPFPMSLRMTSHSPASGLLVGPEM